MIYIQATNTVGWSSEYALRICQFSYNKDSEVSFVRKLRKSEAQNFSLAKTLISSSILNLTVKRKKCSFEYVGTLSLIFSFKVFNYFIHYFSKNIYLVHNIIQKQIQRCQKKKRGCSISSSMWMIVKGILGENPSELIKLQVVNLNFLPDFLVRTTITKKNRVPFTKNQWSNHWCYSTILHFTVITSVASS